ncbi:MAG: phosphotransferase [Gammaproteobacteria bacterium]|nr:phosphotransferase [Gammaproteobacteria bacterium]
MPKVSVEDQQLLQTELEFQASIDYRDLPEGVIHADLFRDNALFVGDRLTGIIDFYYACSFYFIYDLAVSINDWCNSGDQARDSLNAAELLRGYQQQRRVTAAEIRGLAGDAARRRPAFLAVTPARYAFPASG